MKKILPVAITIIAISSAISMSDEVTHRKAALKLAEIMNVKQMLDQITSSMDKMMEQQILAADLPAESREDAIKLAKQEMQLFHTMLSWDQMKDVFVEIYMESFTEQEIGEMIKFYQSPLGQKIIKRMPEMTQKSMEKTQARLQKIMPEYQRNMQKAISGLKEKYKAKRRTTASDL